MRKITFICCLLPLLWACQEKKTPPEFSKNADKIYCFENLEEEWSTRLMFYFEGEDIQGIMEFISPGLGVQTGIFEGRLSGDTLLGRLDLSTESLTIAREVAFLMTDEGLREGKGEMVEEEGRMVFKDRKTLSFEGDLVLVPLQCDSTPEAGGFTPEAGKLNLK
jgi:hypothetical protein